MKKILIGLMTLAILFGGCASQNSKNCGTKQQKKQKYKKMKSGKAPGGNMLH